MLQKNLFLKFIIISVVLISACSTTKEIPKSADEIKIPDYQPTGNEPQVAVLDFSNQSFFESQRLGRAVATMFQTELVKSKRFKVVDRKNLERIMKEYKMGMKGLTNKDVSEVGNQLGVDYFISGDVTEFGVKSTGTSVGASVTDRETGVGGGANVRKGKGTARVAVDVKITDVSNGQIIYMNSAKGKSFSENSAFGVSMLMDEAAVGTEIETGVQGFDETLAGKASRVAAKKMLKKIIKQDVFE